MSPRRPTQRAILAAALSLGLLATLPTAGTAAEPAAATAAASAAAPAGTLHLEAETLRRGFDRTTDPATGTWFSTADAATIGHPQMSGKKAVQLYTHRGHGLYGSSFWFEFTIPTAAVYELDLGYLRSRGFGQYAFSVQPLVGGVPDGPAVPVVDKASLRPKRLDFYTLGTQRAAETTLGTVRLQPGVYRLVAQAIGKHTPAAPAPGATGYWAVVDYLRFRPVRVGVGTMAQLRDTASVTAEGREVGNLVYWPRVSWEAREFGQGRTSLWWQPPGSPVSFQMSGTILSSATAWGQTVVLPTTLPRNGSSIEVLLTATCGTTPSGLTVSVNYATGAVQHVPVPVIPDFAAPGITDEVLAGHAVGAGFARGEEQATSTIALARTFEWLNTQYEGTIPATTQLYRVSLPVLYPGDTITSITLPNTGSHGTIPCDVPVIQVFAVRVAP